MAPVSNKITLSGALMFFATIAASIEMPVFDLLPNHFINSRHGVSVQRERPDGDMTAVFYIFFKGLF